MILTLAKVNLSALFAGMFRRYRSKKKIKPIVAVLIGLLVIYVVGALGITIGTTFYGLADFLFPAGIGWFYFAFMGLLVFALCFIGSIFMVQSQMFSAKDNELLLSMPIKPMAILAGRLCALMVIEVLYSALIVVPAFVVLLITGYISVVPVVGLIFLILSIVLLPLFALALGSFIGWIIALISSRLRNKNIPTLVLSLIFLGAYLWGYSQIVGNINILAERSEDIALSVQRFVFPAYHLGLAIADGSLLSFLIFALCAVAPFYIMCLLLARGFTKLTSGGRGAKKIEYREKALRVSGVMPALIKRELSLLWSQPMYILNTTLGAIVMLVLAIILIVYPGLLLEPLRQASEVVPALDIGIMGALALSALAVMNTVSAPSVSLEGKTLWISRSLPVTARDILLSKAGMHLTVCGLPAAFAAIVCVIILPMSLPQAALTLLMPLAITLMLAFLGVVMNLTFPRFDWINPIQPVKQGASVMLTLFGGMAFFVMLFVLYLLLPGGLVSPEAYMFICVIAFLGISAGLYAYLVGPGARKFRTLS